MLLVDNVRSCCGSCYDVHVHVRGQEEDEGFLAFSHTASFFFDVVLRDVSVQLQVTKPKGEKKARTIASHPVYGTMIKSAIKELKDRKGASKRAILKFIVQKYKVGESEKQINARLRVALKRGVRSGLLTQASGTGAAGRFRLAEKSSHEAAAKIAKPEVKSKAKPETGAAAISSPQKVAMKKVAVKPKSPKKTKKASPAKA
ncbi:unnamed protein product [Angiostrongylus costaricensis]|uniref:H15 domain-containing protein n=1 Tax=Angiostrongylus costaricensis TaxID=334426 RepID=A0A3P7HE60_ANGCS|nr:unnamed protein product [Angiostrongylus costaricensis]